MTKTSPWQLILKAKLSALSLAPEFTADNLAESALAEIGVDALEKAVDDSDVEKLFQNWVGKFPHIKLETNPIDAVMVDAMCTGPSPVTTRGVAVRKYGEASVVAALKARGFASLTALKPTLPLPKSEGKKKEPGPNNPYSPAKANDPDGSKRRAAIVSFVKAAGSTAALRMAEACGCQISGEPLRRK
jgi:hypothetical protein